MPCVANWSLCLDTEEKKTLAKKVTWLDIWNSILQYSDCSNEYVKIALDCLSDRFNSIIESFQSTYHVHSDLLLKVIVYGNEHGGRLLTKLREKNYEASGANNEQWRIIYVACLHNISYLEDEGNVNWLKTYSSQNKWTEFLLQHLLAKLPASQNEKELYDAEQNYIKWVFEESKEKLLSKFYTYSSQFEKIRWDENSFYLIDFLLQKYSNSRDAEQSQTIIRLLCSILCHCSRAVITKIENDLDQLLSLPVEVEVEVEVNHNFFLFGAHYNFISYKLYLCYSLVKAEYSKSTQSEKMIKDFIFSIKDIENTCYLGCLFYLYIYNALKLETNNYEKYLFISKAQLLVNELRYKFIKEVEMATIKDQEAFYENQLCDIISMTSEFIDKKKKYAFSLSNPIASEVITFFKEILLLFGNPKNIEGINPNIRSSVAEVLSDWKKNSSLQFDDHLEELNNALQRDSRRRVSQACL